MTVYTLVLGEEYKANFRKTNNRDMITIEVEGKFVWLDRSQAHMLKLWLEEHLK